MTYGFRILLSAVAFVSLSGCVVAVDDEFVVRADVDAIRINADRGDVTVLRGDEVRVDVEVGGLGTGDIGRQVSDGVLTLDYACTGVELCGGDLVVEAPADVDVSVDLQSGDVEIDDRGGDVMVELGSGGVHAVGLGSAYVEVANATGDVRIAFDHVPTDVAIDVATGAIDVELPPQSYALDLDAGVGSVTVSGGVVDDPDAPRWLHAATALGSVAITGP